MRARCEVHFSAPWPTHVRVESPFATPLCDTIMLHVALHLLRSLKIPSLLSPSQPCQLRRTCIHSMGSRWTLSCPKRSHNPRQLPCHLIQAAAIPPCFPWRRMPSLSTILHDPISFNLTSYVTARHTKLEPQDQKLSHILPFHPIHPSGPFRSILSAQVGVSVVCTMDCDASRLKDHLKDFRMDNFLQAGVWRMASDRRVQG